jgi:hypothetical protein
MWNRYTEKLEQVLGWSTLLFVMALIGILIAC